MVVGLLGLILLLNFWLAVSFILLAALVWLIAGQVAAHFRREARLGSRQAESSLALLVESLGLVRLVKCFQMERFNQSRVERQLAEYGRSGWRKLRGDALAGPLLNSVALMAGVALLYLAARSVLAGEFTDLLLQMSSTSEGPLARLERNESLSALHTCLGELRSRRKIVSLDAPGVDVVSAEAAEHASIDAAAAEYDVARLLQNLPEPYRRVVVLFYLEERSCEAVAQLLGMPEGTVKSLLFRARKRLAAPFCAASAISRPMLRLTKLTALIGK